MILLIPLVLFITNFITTIKTDDKIPIGAVVTNGPECGKIGKSILEKNGTAVDAAIAVLFCEGVSIPNCMGLGGGFLMNVYKKNETKPDFLVSREVAPSAANVTMFNGNETLATVGGLAVAVPGEIKGYYEAYKKYGGGVPWKELVQPTIDLCENGIPVTKYLENILTIYEDLINSDEILKETFINNNTKAPYKEGTTMKRPRLAKTLKLIAEDPNVIHNGSLTKIFVQEIQEKGGIITEDDLKNYQPKWVDPIEISLPNNQTFYAPPLPASGVILGLIMNILSDFLDTNNLTSTTNWQRIVESYKFGFAKRTELGDLDNMTDLIDSLISKKFSMEIQSKIKDKETSEDPEYYGANLTLPDDHGTANMVVYAPNGDIVVVTSTINLDFGAQFMSNSTGIILNNQMDDFSSPGFENHFGVPPSPNNYIAPGKRPVSSMSPSIVVDQNGNVRLAIGGSGGTKIITSVALAMIKNLWYDVDIDVAIADKRMHHQLFPMEIDFEKGFSQEIIKALSEIGHSYNETDLSEGFNTITSISIKNNIIKGAFDPRRGGSVEYIYNVNSASTWLGSLPLCYIFVIILNKFS